MDDNTQPMTDDQVTGDQTPANFPTDDQSTTVPMTEEVAEPTIPATEETPAMPSTESSVEEMPLDKVEEEESFETPVENNDQTAA